MIVPVLVRSSVHPRLMEGGVEWDGDGDEDGGEEDEDVPARLGHAVVAEHPPGALRHRRLVLGQRLDVGGRRAEQRLQRQAGRPFGST